MYTADDSVTKEAMRALTRTAGRDWFKCGVTSTFVAFLVSEDARFVTGNTVFVDGGGHISGAFWEPTPEEDAPEVTDPIKLMNPRTG